MALEDEDRLTLMFEDSPISTRLSGPREPRSDQSIGRPSPRLDKGKAKMSEYKDPNDNASTHSLDSEFEGLDIPIIQTVGAKKALESANETLCRSSREKNPVSRFGYNDYMVYHYAYMMKLTSVRESETFSEAHVWPNVQELNPCSIMSWVRVLPYHDTIPPLKRRVSRVVLD